MFNRYCGNAGFRRYNILYRSRRNNYSSTISFVAVTFCRVARRRRPPHRSRGCVPRGYARVYVARSRRFPPPELVRFVSASPSDDVWEQSTSSLFVHGNHETSPVPTRVAVTVVVRERYAVVVILAVHQIRVRRRRRRRGRYRDVVLIDAGVIVYL